jgi:hypothetical protein
MTMVGGLFQMARVGGWYGVLIPLFEVTIYELLYTIEEKHKRG